MTERLRILSGSVTRLPAGGEEDAFCSLIEPHRPALRAHCDRMLGSPHDADDALQETLLRAWRGLPNFRGGSSLRTWLYRIASNVCLDAIARRPKRMLPIDFGMETGAGNRRELAGHVGPWSAPHGDEVLGGVDDDAAPEVRCERREEVELAFMAALRHLSSRQRAALILRDVLGFSAKEAADSLETTPASVNGALLRARRSVMDRSADPFRQTTLTMFGDRRLRETVERCADAFERGEIDTVLDLLAA